MGMSVSEKTAVSRSAPGFLRSAPARWREEVIYSSAAMSKLCGSFAFNATSALVDPFYNPTYAKLTGYLVEIARDRSVL